jgi:hypothetical protein
LEKSSSEDKKIIRIPITKFKISNNSKNPMAKITLKPPSPSGRGDGETNI